MGSICCNLTITSFGVFANFRRSHPSSALSAAKRVPTGRGRNSGGRKWIQTIVFHQVRQSRDAIKQELDNRGWRPLLPLLLCLLNILVVLTARWLLINEETSEPDQSQGLPVSSSLAKCKCVDANSFILLISFWSNSLSESCRQMVRCFTKCSIKGF